MMDATQEERESDSGWRSKRADTSGRKLDDTEETLEVIGRDAEAVSETNGPYVDRGEEIAELASRIDAAQHKLLTLIREFDEKEEFWRIYGASSCAHWFSWRLGMGPATAREKVRVARALGRLPLIDEALRKGEISYSKVRAITRIATPENETVLLDFARNGTGAMLEKICRMYRQWVEPRIDGIERNPAHERYVTSHMVDWGVHRIVIQLPSDEAALVLKALDSIRFPGNRKATRRLAPNDTPASTHDEAPDAPAEALPTPNGASAPEQDVAPNASAEARLDSKKVEGPQLGAARNGSAEAIHEEREVAHSLEAQPVLSPPARPSGFDRADALVALAGSVLEAGAVKLPASSHRFEVVVNVDAATLRSESETSATLDPGGTAPGEAARRIACDAAIVVMEVNDKGETLNVGRRRRSIPPSIRRALRHRDKGCRFPSCTNESFVDGHHIVHWADGGETKLDNLVLLCRHHHRLVHEEGFRVEMAEDGPRFFRPDGVHLPDVYPPSASRDAMSVVALASDASDGSEEPFESPYLRGFMDWLEESGVEAEREGYPLPNYLPGWDLDTAVHGLSGAAERRCNEEDSLH